MKVSTALWCCVVVVSLCFAEAELNRVAPTFNVSLDAPPKERWNDAVHGIMTEFGWNTTIGPVMGYMEELLPPWAIKLLSPLVAKLDGDMGEIGQEVEGLYEALAPYAPADSVFSLGAVVAMNLIYSFSAACTSIVAQDTAGHVYHGRNLDYPIPGLRNLTAKIQFTKGGEIEYYGTTFIGYAGLLTGMRPGGFSVSLDERQKPEKSPLDGPIDNIISALEGGKPIGAFLRETLATVPTYSEAVTVLNTTRLIAPCYIIVGGASAGEGAVITRDRDHADDSHGVNNGVWTLDPPSAWFRLETNYDHWNAPPASDNRRGPATNGMNAIGQASIDTTGLFKVLSIPPVLNDDTRYTTLMSAGEGTYHVVVRDYTGPR